METLSVGKSFISKKQIMQVALSILAVGAAIIFTKSILLAAVLCVSVSTAMRIAEVAYNAYKLGRSVRTAVAAFMGPTALAWMAIDFLIGWGIANVFANSWLINA
jgi:hypothetical protein